MRNKPQPHILVFPLLLVVLFLSGGAWAAAMETVKIAPDHKGFVLHPSGARYHPWGHNYASAELMERLAKDPTRVEREFAEMKAAGTTVARIHPEMPSILAGPDQANPQALDQLGKLLKIAEMSGIHLQITGLACYQIKARAAWYDAMNEQDRWKTQAFFWETVARVCADSPAVFAYDLVNEPAAVGKPAGGWYTGRMGEVEFCQWLTLDAGQRSGDGIFREWTTRMVAAIRKHDPKHLITMGMLPFPGAYQAAAGQLDFISPHLYPKTGKVDDEIKLLRQFDWGKPIVIGETFPLSCGADDERVFLLKSREFAQGWIGHWPDTAPAELAELKRTGKATINDAIWLSWVDLFNEIGPQMTGGTALSVRPAAGEDKFTLAIIPDVQMEVSDTRLEGRLQWLVGHRDALNLKMVLQCGDLMNFNDEVQYAHQSKALEALDRARLPYAVALGNHDTAAVRMDGGSAAPGNVNTNLRNTGRFNTHFPNKRFEPLGGTYEAGKIDNAYFAFTAGGLNWLVITLELWARTGAVDWAKAVVTSHPNHNIIVLTHAHLNADSTIQRNNGGYGDNSPQFVFDQVMRPYSNVRLVFCGHVGSHGYRVDTGDKGNSIYQFLQCYHDTTANPTRLLEIDTKQGTMTTRIYCPSLDRDKQDGSSRTITGVQWVKP